MSYSVLVPGHITGFFNIENHDVSLKNGSCGVGFLLEKGVKTTIDSSDSLVINVNQGDNRVINQVLSIMEIDTDFKITQDIQLPIGAGFGTSAASAFSLALALNEFLNLGYSQELCGQIAHMAEIKLGGGLGDVIAQSGHGLVLRKEPGAPGVGEIESFREDVYVGWKSFSPIDTSKIIGDMEYNKLLNDVGSKYLALFQREPSLENFLSFSYAFSNEINLMSGEVKNLVDYLKNQDDILGSSMAMLGNTAFAFAYSKDTLKNLNIKDFHIDKINNFGIVYD